MKKTITSLFGRRLRTIRLLRGIPQDKLGVMIGLDESCASARMSRYENGIHAPAFDIAESIAKALEVPVTYFYCNDDEMADLLIGLHQLSEAQMKEVSTLVSELRKTTASSH